MRVNEVWYCKHCVCLPRDGGSTFVLEPVIPYTLTPLFLVFDYPYTGELSVTGDYPVDAQALTPSTISTFMQLKRLGVTYISGLQDLSINFKADETASEASFFRRTTSTPFAELIQTTIVQQSSTTPSVLLPVSDGESFPANREWYPVTWQDTDTSSSLALITPGLEHELVGFIRYPIDGRARLVSSGELTVNQTLVNDDYFLDLTSVNYLTQTPPTNTSIVRVGRGINSYTLQLDIEVLVWQ